MKPLICRSVLWMGMLALVALLPVSAQQPAPTAAAGPAEIEVSGVKFNSIRVPNSPSAWYEIEIDLNAKPAAPATRFLNRVKVTLNLATKVAAPGAKANSYEFYRSSAEMAAVETGKATVRFYLPPEVLKRDASRGEPDFWLVELSVGGTAIPTVKAATSSSISDKAKLDNFKSKISSEGGANDGVLLPQYLSPFAYDTSRQSPSFIRTEGNR